MGQTINFALRELCVGGVALGSIADIAGHSSNVRFIPNSDSKKRTFTMTA